MARYTHQGSAELIKCKLCSTPAEKFVQGLWPLCDDHAIQYLNTEGDTVFKRLDKIQKEIRSNENV